MNVLNDNWMQRADDCRGLFIKHGGVDHAAIERDMRGLGYHKFNRRILYARRSRKGIVLPGWIERFGWRSLLTCSPEIGSWQPKLKGAPKNDFEDFQAWLKLVSPNMTWTWRHQMHIYKYLKRVTDGESRRLMIFLPPRHGKSELVTVRYTAWRLKREPGMNVIIGSYNQRLANRFSRKVRSVLADDAAIFARPRGPVQQLKQTAEAAAAVQRTDAGQQPQTDATPLQQQMPEASPYAYTYRPVNSESEWETPAGGGLRAVGVGSGVTGYGASLIVIDDPIKSRAEAESETYRRRLRDWFNDDLYTRLEPKGAIILIQTRWHEDDLAGRLLREAAEETGEKWDVISLPALAESANDEFRISNIESENITNSSFPYSSFDIRNSTFSRDPLGRSPGEALCPERYPVAELEKVRRRLGSYSFAALYQQRPVPAEGGLFKRAWFKSVVTLPPGVRKKRGYDLGISKDPSADYTATFGVAYDNDGNMYIYGGFRRRMEYPEQRRMIVQRLESELDTEHAVELAGSGDAIIQDLRRDTRVRGRPLRGVRPREGKIARALPWIALAEEGRVFLVRGGWNEEFLDEVVAFPSGKHDDQIDAVSLAVHLHQAARRTGHSF